MCVVLGQAKDNTVHVVICNTDIDYSSSKSVFYLFVCMLRCLVGKLTDEFSQAKTLSLQPVLPNGECVLVSISVC